MKIDTASQVHNIMGDVGMKWSAVMAQDKGETQWGGSLKEAVRLRGGAVKGTWTRVIYLQLLEETDNKAEAIFTH